MVEGKKVSVCCVPSSSLVNIKAEKHDFTWEVICDSVAAGWEGGGSDAVPPPSEDAAWASEFSFC